MFFLILALASSALGYDAVSCIFGDAAPYGNQTIGTYNFTDYDNLTYYEGDGHQLYLKTLVMCSDASVAFIGIRSSFSALDSTNDTIT